MPDDRWAIAFRPRTERDAAAIAAWRYEGPYAFYNLDKDPADLAEFLDPATPRIWGFIADEVAQVAPELVSYDDRGRPEGVMYDRVVVGLLDVVRDLTARVDDLARTASA